MSIRVLIVEDNAVARSFLTRVVRESFSDEIRFSEASDLDSARQWLGIGPGGPVARLHGRRKKLLAAVLAVAPDC